nr:anti-CBASS Acb1 family protein [Atlantibacter hermannii]
MRRANYLNAIGIGGSNTKRPTLYQEFGYPRTITFSDFYNMYRRNAAGFAVVHRLLDGCWQDYPVIIDGDEAEEAKETNPWEKKVTKFMKKLWSKVKDADRRNMIGRYSALLLQVKDNRDWGQEVDISLVKRLGESALVKLIPVWEPQLTVTEWDNDRESPTFGQPLMFNFNEQPVGDVTFIGPTRGEPVHPSRVILFCEGSEDDNTLSGIPLLEAGYNKLLDIEKISGGGAEGFLKNASRQIAVEFSEKTDMATLAGQAKEAGYQNLGEAMGDKVNKLNRGTDAAAVMQAGQMRVLSVTPGDPGPTWEVTANELAASVQIPFTILFGQQTGRLASDEDKTDWAIRRNTRRNTFLTDRITALLERFWTLGVIDPPTNGNGEVTIQWSDLLAPGEKEKIENMSKLADVVQKTTGMYGGEAPVTINELRQVIGLEPLPAPTEPPKPDDKVTTDDPLADDTRTEGEGGPADSSTQQG